MLVNYVRSASVIDGIMRFVIYVISLMTLYKIVRESYYLFKSMSGFIFIGEINQRFS